MKRCLFMICEYYGDVVYKFKAHIKPFLSCIRKTFQHSVFSCLCTQSLYVWGFASLYISHSLSASVCVSLFHSLSSSVCVSLTLRLCVCVSLSLCLCLFSRYIDTCCYCLSLFVVCCCLICLFLYLFLCQSFRLPCLDS